MPEVGDFRDELTTRLRILDDLQARLETIQRGTTIPGSSKTYKTTVRSVFQTADAEASLIDSQIPSIAIWDLGTVFEEGGGTADGGGLSATGSWKLGLMLVVRDEGMRDERNNVNWRKLEVLFVDVERCLYSALPCQAGGADVQWTIDAFVIDYDRPDCGIGWLELAVTYEDLMRA
jgi:hypothetical protein